MDTQKNTKALCFFEQGFVQKHNAFFSLKEGGAIFSKL